MKTNTPTNDETTPVVFLQTVCFDSVTFQLQFSAIHAGAETKYFVLATDENENRHAFNMEKKGIHWRIVNAPKVPDVFLAHEAALSEMIKQQAAR